MYLPPTTMIEYSGASEPMLESSVLKYQARLEKDGETMSCNRKLIEIKKQREFILGGCI